MKTRIVPGEEISPATLRAGDYIQPANFDPDFSPDHEINKSAARARNLTYNPRTKQYHDVDGCPVRDEFGQPL